MLRLEVEIPGDGWTSKAQWEYETFENVEEARERWEELVDEVEYDEDAPFVIGVKYENDGKTLLIDEMLPFFARYSFDDVLSAIDYGVEHDIHDLSMYDYGTRVLKKKNLVD